MTTDNHISLTLPDLGKTSCPRIDDPVIIREGYQQYLSDESRLLGTPPERIYFPKSTIEAAAA